MPPKTLLERRVKVPPDMDELRSAAPPGGRAGTTSCRPRTATPKGRNRTLTRQGHTSHIVPREILTDRCGSAQSRASSPTAARGGRRGAARRGLSDFLNGSERDFVSLTDVVVELIGRDGPGTAHDFMAVARRHIVFAIPESGLNAGV